MGTWHESKSNVEILKKIESIKDDIQENASEVINEKFEKIDQIQNLKIKNLTDSLDSLEVFVNEIDFSLVQEKNYSKSQQEQLVLIFNKIAQMEAKASKNLKVFLAFLFSVFSLLVLIILFVLK